MSPLHSHGLNDPYEPNGQGWLPQNAPTVELVSCIEACMQINELQGAFAFGAPTPRQLTILATPLCTLVKHVLALKKLLHSADRSAWPASDLATFKVLGRSLKRANHGPLVKIRNMRAAHLEPEGFVKSVVPASNAENVLVFLGEAAALLLLSLNHERVFCYYRRPEPTDPTQIEVFAEYPLATTFRVHSNDKPPEILQVHMEADLRHAQNAIVRETIALYNRLAVGFTKLPRIGIQSYEPKRPSA